MDDIKKFIAGSIITLVVGGTAYSFTQEDVVNNFANDTGVSQEQAEQYVSGITEDDLDTYSNIGNDLIIDGQDLLNESADLDCVNYEYEWESPTLSCYNAKDQLSQMGNESITLGRSYIQLDADNATQQDMRQTINNIDSYNTALNNEIITFLLNSSDIEDIKNSNSYNKAVFQSAIESE